MKTCNFVSITCCMWATLALSSNFAKAQTLTTIFNFTEDYSGHTGRDPGQIVLGENGNLLGVTSEDGPLLGGTVYEITTTGKVVAQYSFNAFTTAGGSIPVGLAGENGTLYGTTFSGGGSENVGTIFEISGGQLKTLYSFCSQSHCTDGSLPEAGVVRARNGTLYGTTSQGGASECSGGIICGTVFSLAPNGQFTTLYNFCSVANCADGASPQAALVQGRDGNFYGTTYFGGSTAICGSSGCGTIFKITPGGQLTTLYQFCSKQSCNDGAAPAAALIEASDGDFYGTTLFGGVTSSPYCSAGCGTVFKITPDGVLTTLHRFCGQSGCPDGRNPASGLLQANDGNFYGGTELGGLDSNGDGTLFRLSPSGLFKTVWVFCSLTNCEDGAAPTAALIQAPDGTFYGTTSGNGGAEGFGTVFQLDLGLSAKR